MKQILFCQHDNVKRWTWTWTNHLLPHPHKVDFRKTKNL